MRRDAALRSGASATLALALVGPMQCWSLSGPYRERTTQLIPTKSGVVGLLAAALGRSRDADIDDLASLRLHVRVDRPGRKVRDFQTARGALRANGKADDSVAITRREYLEDAAFLALLEGNEKLLKSVEQAVRQPVFPMYFGQRCCLPSRPLPMTTTPGATIETLFTSLPDLSGHGGQKQAYLETPQGSMVVRDVPGRSTVQPGRMREAQWFERALQPVLIELSGV